MSRRVVERRVAAVRGALAERLRALGGVAVEEHDDGVVLSGRGLARRVMADPRLLWVAGWWR